MFNAHRIKKKCYFTNAYKYILYWRNWKKELRGKLQIERAIEILNKNINKTKKKCYFWLFLCSLIVCELWSGCVCKYAIIMFMYICVGVSANLSDFELWNENDSQQNMQRIQRIYSLIIIIFRLCELHFSFCCFFFSFLWL